MRLGLCLVLTAWGAASAALALPPDAQFASSLRAALAPTPVNAPTPDTVSADGLTWYSHVRVGGADPADSRLDISTSAYRVAPGAVFGPQNADTLQPRSYDLSYTHAWPSALILASGKYNFDVSPHATFGLGGSGRSAEAGAMVRFGKNLEQSVTNRLNIKDGASFGAQSRWYVFAAASGRAVGMNLMNNDGDWRRAGLSQDNANALIGDTQAGVGWRKGPMTASVGYIRRNVKIRQGLEGLMGAGDRGDDLVAVAFSIKPQR